MNKAPAINANVVVEESNLAFENAVCKLCYFFAFFFQISILIFQETNLLTTAAW